jgi:PKD repeat protein
MSTEHLNAVCASCLLLCLICSGLFADLVAAEPSTRVAGVKVGDMAKYGNFLALWASESPDAVTPQNYINVNNTLYLINTVQAITDNTVSFESRTIYRNGTDYIQYIDVNVASGTGPGNLTFVAAGLEAGDRVYNTEAFSGIRINSTTLREYCGVMRETNTVNATEALSDVAVAFYTQLYWDKATGLLVEHLWSYSEYSQEGYWSGATIMYNMVDNNVWVGVDDSFAPIAKAGSDRTVDVGTTVVFNANESWDDVGIASILWDFGDGKSATGLSVTHVYDTTGNFNVTLTVEDSAGHKDSDHIIVTVQKPPNPILTPGAIFLIASIIIIASLLSVRWALRKRRLSAQRRKRKARLGQLSMCTLG